VTVAQAFGQDLSEREARQIIQGQKQSTASHEEQERRLQKMLEKHGWDAQDASSGED